jgi:hypothetical protein
VAFAAGAGLVAACGSGSSNRLSKAQAAEAGRILSACRSDPHEGVHDPQRLDVLAPCVAVTGTVVEVPKLPLDGDHTFNIAVDDPYANMLNDQNRQEGGLHVEIVPEDQPGCTQGQPITQPPGYNNLGVCSGADIPWPTVGQRVRVVGSYVHDTWAGPNEIHPAWSVEVLPPAAPPPTTQFPPVTTSPSVSTVLTQPPAPPPLRASLTGRAVPAHKGAAGGSGSFSLKIDAGRACWVFGGVRGIGSATRAWIGRGTAGHVGPTLLALGKTYKARGCTPADADLFEPVIEQPARFYVVVANRKRPAGAIRGQLAKAR